MRADLKLSTLALAALLVAPAARAQQAPAATPPGAQQPITLAPSQVPVAPVTDGSQLAFSGYTVPRGQVVDGDVVVPFGDATVQGEVTGNVTVGKGNLILLQGGVIRGDAVVNGGGQLLNHGGRVLGEMRVNSDEDEGAGPADDQVVEVRRDVRQNAREHLRIRHGGWWGSISEGAEGLVSTLTLGLIFCLIGAGMVFYALPQLERVSNLVRRDTLRSTGVGVASNFLALPTFIIGVVVLAVTIIGIPLLILYVPLFWVALMAAAAYGVVAVAHAIGERTAEQSGSFAASRRNAYNYVFTGIGMLLAPLFAAHLLELTGFLGWLGDLVEVLGVLILWGAATLGFGAVALSRAGTRTGWPWQPRPLPYDPIFDDAPAYQRAADVG
jgi:hypothetical protein